MRRRIFLLAAAALAATATPALGAVAGTVDAKVTVASPCIMLSRSSIDFGGGGLSRPGTPMTQLQNHQLDVASCGTGAQTLYARGTNAVASDGSGDTWSLVQAGQSDLCTVGPNTYILTNRLWNGSASVAVTGLTTVNRAFVDGAGSPYGLAGAASLRVDQLLFMPCAGSVGAGKAMSFQLTYTASL
jgi:hypothetical protein